MQYINLYYTYLKLLNYVIIIIDIDIYYLLMSFT